MILSPHGGGGWEIQDGAERYYFETKIQAEVFISTGKQLSYMEAIMATEPTAVQLYIDRLLELKRGISNKYDDAKILTRFGEDTDAVETILAMPVSDAEGNLLTIPGSTILVLDLHKLIGTLQAIEQLMENVLQTTGELPRKTLGKLIGGK